MIGSSAANEAGQIVAIGCAPRYPAWSVERSEVLRIIVIIKE